MLWLLGWLFRNSLVILDMTVLYWRRERKQWDQTHENTLWISGRMVNVVPSSEHSVNILPGYICLCGCVSVQVNAHWHIMHHLCWTKNVKEESSDVICMPLPPQVWFQSTKGRVASEASCYADPHSSPKRITGFAALSAHPDGIQGSFDSPEQALQLLCHPQISLT